MEIKLTHTHTQKAHSHNDAALYCLRNNENIQGSLSGGIKLLSELFHTLQWIASDNKLSKQISEKICFAVGFKPCSSF